MVSTAGKGCDYPLLDSPWSVWRRRVPKSHHPFSYLRALNFIKISHLPLTSSHD
jgi:hypothetical protein